MNMTFEYYLLEVKDGIAILTVNRPEARNAMRVASWTELRKFIAEAEQDDTNKAIIITGAGEKAFIAGADINELKTNTPVRSLNSDARIALRAMEECPKPIIAAINGFCFGGGFELALACDIRLASTNAQMGLPEVNIGIMPGAGGTIRLPRIVGIGVAKEVILAGRVLSAEEAHALGAVMKVTEQKDLLDAAIEVAKTILSKGPLGIKIAKRVVNAAFDVDLASGGSLLEAFGFGVLLSSEDKLEGTSAFLEKRKAEFKGK
ncbi:MAG: enoyl-CoA hydratase/isomerase family protein [Oscillospiraceae bacterium]